jgi:hypothetical protein
MVLNLLAAIVNIVLSTIHKTLNEHLVSNFTLLVRGIEIAIFVFAAIVFLLLAVSITLRRAKNLPASYEIHILDLDGRQVRIDGLRETFSTFDAAESYARLYQTSYANQYRFKVTGRSKNFLGN